jgi:predicted methyltransferase
MRDFVTGPKLAPLAALLMLAAGTPAAAGDAREAIQAAVDGEHRSAGNRARDAYRHPVETLTFFGLEPDMTVVELWPGGGWYTEILAPVLKEEGKLYAASWDPTLESDYVQRNLPKYTAKIADREVYGDVELTVLGRSRMDIAPPDSADLVVTFRNLHSWGEEFTGEVFAAAYEALKPGGVLGVVQHRADPDSPPDPDERTGYFSEARAVELAEAAGFELVARSDINANPKDTKDYESGVWALPPSLRDGPEPEYLEIGESDRFTLKFMKPE